MPEILFRGKRLDTDEWVYGYFAVFGGLPFIGASNSVGTMMWFSVDPETVAQYSGFTDKHGTKIFAGDVARFTNNDGTSALYKVVWATNFGGWMLKWVGHADRLYLSAICELVEIIGNIHEPGKLLEATSGQS